MTLRSIPPVVYLPTGIKLSPSEMRNALGGVSRAAVLWWKKEPHNFPRAYGTNNQSYYMAKEVAEWLESRGVVVKWI